MVAKVFVSPFDQSCYHLSLEEYCLKREVFEGPYVLFYVNRPSVIMGRNQNPWREINLRAVQENHVALGRRITGGGTVYHDYGNVNYAVIYQRRQFSEESVFEWINRGLWHAGIESRVGTRKELLVDGSKFSGTAFGRYQDRVIHHGTLLLSADLQAMDRYLEVNGQILFSKAVISVPSKVINLVSVNPQLNRESLIAALVNAFEGPASRMADKELAAIMSSSEYLKLLDKHQSWKWIFGETPSFSIADPLPPYQALRIQNAKLSDVSQEVGNAVAQQFLGIKLSNRQNEGGNAC